MKRSMEYLQRAREYRALAKRQLVHYLGVTTPDDVREVHGIVDSIVYCAASIMLAAAEDKTGQVMSLFNGEEQNGRKVDR